MNFLIDEGKFVVGGVCGINRIENEKFENIRLALEIFMKKKIEEKIVGIEFSGFQV